MPSLFRTPAQTEDLALFTRHLAGAMQARAPLPVILRAFVVESEQGAVRRAVGAMADRVESGVALSAAMEEHPAVFPAAYRRLVRLGEQGRALGGVMTHLADSLEESLKTYEYFRRAAIYPALILILLFLDICFVMYKIVPKFADIYAQLGSTLSASTNALVTMFSGLQALSFFALVLLIPILFSLGAAMGLRVNGFGYGRMMLSLPLVGPVMRRAETARFANNLALLLENRVPLAEALGLLADSSENSYVRLAIQDLHYRFQSGERLSDLIATQPLFPATMAAMIASAEDQGRLAETLTSLGRFYAQRTSHGLTVLREVFEPVMLLLIGLFIAFTLVSFYMPLFSIPKLIGNG
ncbi:MAG: type II secretion system F family protein [Candidatus Sumerlaeota bacterium]|nr:type II secretion system F family protein [Candidatus Sumerlaeota bacterium]